MPSPLESARQYETVALVLQGGGALGAYQCGVYEALHEAGIRPSWFAGTSIGAINAAILAGNAPERRVERRRGRIRRSGEKPRRVPAEDFLSQQPRVELRFVGRDARGAQLLPRPVHGGMQRVAGCHERGER